LHLQQPYEAANYFAVKSLTAVCPRKRVSEMLTPSYSKVIYPLDQGFYRCKPSVLKTLVCKNAEPYLNHVQPRAMKGQEVHGNPFAWRL